MKKTVKDYIRTIVDFPHEGILFRDVTTLFADARGFRMAIDQLLTPYAGLRIDKVAGLEARGFIPGAERTSYIILRGEPVDIFAIVIIVLLCIIAMVAPWPAIHTLLPIL